MEGIIGAEEKRRGEGEELGRVGSSQRLGQIDANGVQSCYSG